MDSLSPVQTLNYLALNLLRDTARASPMAACATFGITKEDLDELLPNLSPERVLATVTNSDDKLLFQIRPNLPTVLASPLPLAGALFAVQRLHQFGSVGGAQ